MKYINYYLKDSLLGVRDISEEENAMYSIGELCTEFKFSRSTLLYYDKIGLLTPSKRTESNYRKYSEEDRSRLIQICTFKEAGVSLNEIKNLLDNNGTNESFVLEKRLKELNKGIRDIKAQQKIIIEMLKTKNISDKNLIIDKETFTSILKAAGLEDTTLKQLHIQLEKNSPDAHQLFLEFLGISEEEIKLIRNSHRGFNG